jgi:hypothetical protein
MSACEAIQEAAEAVAGEEAHGPGRIQRSEDRRLGADHGDAQHGQGDEPDDHDRPEEPTDRLRAPVLDREQANEDDRCDRQHHPVDRWCCDLETLDR